MTAFIWFIYRMCFQVSYKITFHWQSLGTFVALICFSPSVYFKMPYKLNIIQKALSHSLHWHGSSPEWVNICKLKIHWNKSQCVIRIGYTLKMTEIVFSSDLFRRILLFCFNKKKIKILPQATACHHLTLWSSLLWYIVSLKNMFPYVW